MQKECLSDWDVVSILTGDFVAMRLCKRIDEKCIASTHFDESRAEPQVYRTWSDLPL